jgi:hypothetical protein
VEQENVQLKQGMLNRRRSTDAQFSETPDGGNACKAHHKLTEVGILLFSSFVCILHDSKKGTQHIESLEQAHG